MVSKRLLKKVLLIAAGLAVGLIITELSLRLLFLLGEKQLLGLKSLRTTITWQEDPDIGKVLLSPYTKGWFVTPSREYYTYIEGNKEGFYDTDHTPQKPSGVYRIILLGDSFVASLQTPKNRTVGKLLEKNLNDLNLGKKFEVISIGMGDTGTAQQYIALKKIGLKYHPDLVVQMFLTANDLKNNWPSLQQDPYRPYFSLEDGKLVELPHLRKSQRKFFYIKENIKKLRLVELLLAARQRLQENIANKNSDYPIDYHVYDLNYNSDYQKSWDATQKLIMETQKASEGGGSKYLLAVLANNEQVNRDVWLQLQKDYPKLVGNVDLTKPDKLLKTFCDQQALNCLFMLPIFQNYVSQNPGAVTHYRIDGHWNQLGTNLATQILTDNIKNQVNNPISE